MIGSKVTEILMTIFSKTFCHSHIKRSIHYKKIPQGNVKKGHWSQYLQFFARKWYKIAARKKKKKI